jgi:predicted MFS family arabinose efflux permease
MTTGGRDTSSGTRAAMPGQGASPSGWVGVAAVTLGTFTLVTNEFIPVGLLTNIATDMHVTLGVAGTTVTIPGLVAAAAAPLITVAVGQLDRRIVLALMSIAFIVADVLAALAPNIGVLLLARFALGLGIGGFWAIGASIGDRLVGRASAGRATAVIFSGVSIATVLGVPLGTFIGGLFGWRTAFLATAVLGLVALILQLVVLPPIRVDQPVTFRQLAAVLRGPNSRAGLIATLLLVVGNFAAYTFIEPFLLQHTEVSPGQVSVFLLLYGIAGIVGNFAVGRPLATRMRPTILTVITALGLSILAMPLLGVSAPGAFLVLALWGLCYGALPVAMQTWVFTADRIKSEGGSALYISCFQISLASGAFIGGRIVDATDIPTTMFTGAALAAVALAAFAALSKPVPTE